MWNEKKEKSLKPKAAMRENYNARHNHHFMEKFNSKALLVD